MLNQNVLNIHLYLEINILDTYYIYLHHGERNRKTTKK